MLQFQRMIMGVFHAAFTQPRLLLLMPLVLSAVAAATPLGAQSGGEAIYIAQCVQCHGEEGDGRGVAFDMVFPRPRDFTSGMIKFRTTDSGEYPTRENLMRIIAQGMPGTSMPAWKRMLSPKQIGQVARYVQQFYESEDDELPEVMQVPSPPPVTEDSIARGSELFETLECNRCHGNRGRGDGYSSMTLRDDWNDEPIYPRNLTAGWFFRGGHEAVDIYRTVMFGLNGTPMPAHFEEEVLAGEAARWALVHYVRSLSADEAPEVRSTIVSRWTPQEIPLDADDPLWALASPYYIPLAGQVNRTPELFQPSVRYLWVQSLYNDNDIALRVTWVDPTSKDNEAFREALNKAQEESEEQQSGENGEGGHIAPDELTIQFPAKLALGRPLPYFLMGRPGKPVNLWVWRNDADTMANAKSSRLGKWKPLRGGSNLRSKATYRDGLYSLIVMRSRKSAARGELQFDADPGIFPISFSVADGFKGDGGTRRAVATWYNLLLERPIGASFYFFPIAVAALIALLQWWLLIATRRAGARQSPGMTEQTERFDHE